MVDIVTLRFKKKRMSIKKIRGNGKRDNDALMRRNGKWVISVFFFFLLFVVPKYNMLKMLVGPKIELYRNRRRQWKITKMKFQLQQSDR